MTLPEALADRVRVVGRNADGRVLLAVPPAELDETVDALSAWQAS